MAEEMRKAQWSEERTTVACLHQLETLKLEAACKVIGRKAERIGPTINDSVMVEWEAAETEWPDVAKETERNIEDKLGLRLQLKACFHLAEPEEERIRNAQEAVERIRARRTNRQPERRSDDGSQRERRRCINRRDSASAKIGGRGKQQRRRRRFR